MLALPNLDDHMDASHMEQSLHQVVDAQITESKSQRQRQQQPKSPEESSLPQLSKPQSPITHDEPKQDEPLLEVSISKEKESESAAKLRAVPSSHKNNVTLTNHPVDMNTDPQRVSLPPKLSYHTIFSTGCSIYQDWQSYIFFYHFLQSGQQGHLTRIASGCNEVQESELSILFKQKILVMAPNRFHLHFTPDFSRVKPGHNFKYFNKPYGTQHWMTHALGYPKNHAYHDDTIVMLMDPDQIILRPFTNDFTNSSEVWKVKGGYKMKVEHGSPFAQQYGFGLQWNDKIHMDHIAPDSPVVNMDRHEMREYFSAMGPPYVATARDMFSIVTKWCEFVPKIHDDYPHLLAEMFGYNLAAAHLELKHSIAHSFMVSDPSAGGEGWKLIDQVEAEDVCDKFPADKLPHVLHYCQRYMLGKWFIGKYRLRKDFISCESPLLTLPPPDVALKYDYFIAPGDKLAEPKKYKGPRPRKYHAFMMCALIKGLNDAATYFKDHHCEKETANYEKSYVFFEDMSTPEDEM